MAVGFDEVFVFGELCYTAVQVPPFAESEESRTRVPRLHADHAKPVVVALGFRVEEDAAACPLLFLFERKAIVGKRFEVALDALLDVRVPILCDEERTACLRVFVRPEDRFEVAGFEAFLPQEFVVLQLLIVDLLLNFEQRLLVCSGRLEGFRDIADSLARRSRDAAHNAALRKAFPDVRHGGHGFGQRVGLLAQVLTSRGFEHCGELRRNGGDHVGRGGGSRCQLLQTHLEGGETLALFGLSEHVVDGFAQCHKRVFGLHRVLQSLELISDLLYLLGGLFEVAEFLRRKAETRDDLLIGRFAEIGQE